MPSNRNDGCPRLGNMIARSVDADDGDITTPFSRYSIQSPSYRSPDRASTIHDRKITSYRLTNRIKLMLPITFSFANPFAYACKDVILVNKYVQHMYLFADLICFMYVT